MARRAYIPMRCTTKRGSHDGTVGTERGRVEPCQSGYPPRTSCPLSDRRSARVRVIRNRSELSRLPRVR